MMTTRMKTILLVTSTVLLSTLVKGSGAKNYAWLLENCESQQHKGKMRGRFYIKVHPLCGQEFPPEILKGVELTKDFYGKKYHNSAGRWNSPRPASCWQMMLSPEELNFRYEHKGINAKLVVNVADFNFNTPTQYYCGKYESYHHPIKVTIQLLGDYDTYDPDMVQPTKRIEYHRRKDGYMGYHSVAVLEKPQIITPKVTTGTKPGVKQLKLRSGRLPKKNHTAIPKSDAEVKKQRRRKSKRPPPPPPAKGPGRIQSVKQRRQIKFNIPPPPAPKGPHQPVNFSSKCFGRGAWGRANDFGREYYVHKEQDFEVIPAGKNFSYVKTLDDRYWFRLGNDRYCEQRFGNKIWKFNDTTGKWDRTA